MAEDMVVEENTSIADGTADSVQSSNMIVEEEEEPESELDNLWKVVNKDPRDFTSWTYLLDYVEKGDDIENARKAFDQFLYRYPYCYGYWKKYAELEKRHHDLERCIEVYERGVKAIPMSVDLWTAYLDTALDIYQTSEDFEWTIKSIYERAIEAAGLEFRSDKLWEHFISWTSNNGRLSDATKIYDQLLRTATQMYYQNWENFKKHVEDNETQSIIPPEELEIWKDRILGVQKPTSATNKSIISSAKSEKHDGKSEICTPSPKVGDCKDDVVKEIDNEAPTKAIDEIKNDISDMEIDIVHSCATKDAAEKRIAESEQTNSISDQSNLDAHSPIGPKGDTLETTAEKGGEKDDQIPTTDKEQEKDDQIPTTDKEQDNDDSVELETEPSESHKTGATEPTEAKHEECKAVEAREGDAETTDAAIGVVESNETESEEMKVVEVESTKAKMEVVESVGTKVGGESETDTSVEAIADSSEPCETKAAGESSPTEDKTDNSIKAAVDEDEEVRVKMHASESTAEVCEETLSTFQASDETEPENLKENSSSFAIGDPVLNSANEDNKEESNCAKQDTVATEVDAGVDVTTADEKKHETVDSIHTATKEEDVKIRELTIADWSQIKTKFIEDREQIYQKTYEQITKRWYFEEKIRRPYFHVKPLEKSQLTNWREYLDMETSEGDFARVKALFERCLIACALYEEFWMRYATYMESNEKIDDARRIWESSCSVHLPHRPQLHWKWALFEERQKNNKAAVEVITRGCRECPGDVKLAIRRLSLLRRSQTATLESVSAEYESTIEKFASENIACASVLSLKYSRFLDREKNDREQAERVLREAIARDETNERLYMQLVDLKYRQPDFDWRTCDSVLRWIVGLTSLPLRLRLRFCQRRHEMLEESSDDIQVITSALSEYEEMQREMETANELEADATNTAVDGGGVSHSTEIDGEPPSKRARTVNGSSTDAQDNLGYSSYDSSYHHYGSTGTTGDHNSSATDLSHVDSSAYGHQSHSGSNPQAYAAAAAAAAANAAYPGYSGSGNASWDSYYNSYYGYYAGYYGASGEHGDWQTQGMTG